MSSDKWLIRLKIKKMYLQAKLCKNICFIKEIRASKQQKKTLQESKTSVPLSNVSSQLHSDWAWLEAAVLPRFCYDHGKS